MMGTPSLPEMPAWIGWTLRRLLSDDERRVVLAELAELHQAWRTSLGPREADRRYLRQLRQYPFLLVAHRVRTRRTIPIPGFGEIARAARSLVRAPGLAATIVLTVGIGIGGCTTIFAVVDALYLRDIPYPDPDRIQVVYSQEGANRWGLSAVDVLALQEQATDFSEIAAVARATRTFRAGESAQVLITYAVSPGLFHLLGVPVLSGRAPTEADAVPDAPGTALVTLGFARAHLGSRRPDGSDAVGRSITLDGAPCDVLGVLPSNFGPIARGTQVFTTLQLAPPTRKGPFFMFAVGRLRDGVTPQVATEQLHDITRRLFPLWQSSFQNQNATWGIEPLQKNLRGDATRLVQILLGAGILVLLIATANASGLLLARVTSRRTELAVRSALGASRGRVVAHLLAESAVLALGGVLVGLALARGGILVLPVLASGYIPRLDEVTVSGPVLAFSVLLAAGSGLVFGLVPALRRPPDRRMAEELRSGGRGATGGRESRRIQRFLVAGQLAVSMPLLAGAGLLLSSFAHLQGVHPGFDAEHVASMRISLPNASYPGGGDRESFWEEAVARVSALPGVMSVALSDSRPPDDHPIDNNFDLEDRPSPTGAQPVVPWIFADTGFFHTLDIPLLAGRMFDADDVGAANPVVVVDEAWARRFFPGERAVGRRMRNGGDTSSPLTTVVGVVGDVPWSGLAKRDQGVVYDPNLRRWARNPFLYIRARGDPSRIIEPVRGVIRSLDPGVPVTDVATADEAIQASLTHPRNLTLVISLFSVVALALAVLGLYGVMTYAVQRRRGDIAVRLTLGGSPRSVLRMVTVEGMRLAFAGLVVGLGGALLLTRALTSLLYDVGPRDPLTLVGSALTLLAVSAVACLVPALRAIRVNPATILREE
jgi:predicted permease